MNILETINLARKIIDEKTQKKLEELSTELFCIELIKRISEVLTENKFTYKDTDSIVIEGEDGFCKRVPLQMRILEAIDKVYNPKSMELTCKCPYCNKEHLFLTCASIKEDTFKCLICDKEFRIGEY